MEFLRTSTDVFVNINAIEAIQFSKMPTEIELRFRHGTSVKSVPIVEQVIHATIWTLGGMSHQITDTNEINKLVALFEISN